MDNKELIDFMKFTEGSSNLQLLERICKTSESIGMYDFRAECEKSNKLKEQRWFIMCELKKRLFHND